MKKYLFILWCIFTSVNYTLSQIKPSVINIPKNDIAAKLTVAKSPIQYRITINGFVCKRPTYDHMLEVDGKGDEIFFYAWSKKMNVNDNPTIYKSLVFGDVNNDKLRNGNRIKAGSKIGEQGGLQSGDYFPLTNTGRPYLQYNKPNKKTLPFILSEGILTDNDQIIVFPSIWEYDGTTEAEQALNLAASCFERGFLDVVSLGSSFAVAKKIEEDEQRESANFTHRVGIYGQPILTPTQKPEPFQLRVMNTFFGDAKDRPIGMKYEGSSGFYYQPKAIAMSYDSLLHYSKKDVGYGKGIYQLFINDDTRMAGMYVIYVQIETTNTGIPFAMDNFFDPYSLKSLKLKYTFSNVQSNAPIPLIQTENPQINLLPNSTNNQWHFEKVPNTENQFYIKNSGRALDVLAHSLDNNVPVILFPTNNATNQRWNIIPYGVGTFSIIANESGKALSWDFNTNKLIQYENRYNPDQRWKIE